MDLMHSKNNQSFFVYRTLNEKYLFVRNIWNRSWTVSGLDAGLLFTSYRYIIIYFFLEIKL
jgi:hypothetical protein